MSTTPASRTAGRKAANGGIAARRAVVRWAWRLVRRQWRQQILVLALLALAVAAAAASVSFAYNANAPDNAELGSARQLLKFDGSDRHALAAHLAAARTAFGTIDVIGHRSVPIPGSVESLDVRAQDPQGAYGGPMLRLLEGSYPRGSSQVAVTDSVARTFQLHVGSKLALEGDRWTVVGIVENPLDLDDEFALVAPPSAGPSQYVTVLLSASPEAFESFRTASTGVVAAKSRPSRQTSDALAMLATATVFLLLASLVAAAGFAVVAQRRLRQLGMLAAVGATQKHLRLVLLAGGAAIGAIAAVLGTIVGLLLWVAFAPTVETAVGHRIGWLSLPWSLIALAGLLTVVAATVAAWWPGRAVARLPITLALSARPPRPKPAHRSSLLAFLLIAAGAASLALAHRTRAPLIVGGILATILGTLLISPLAIRALARAAARTPIAVRLALRDLGRYQARSGAALAAISLALGIAAAIIIAAAAEEKQLAGEPYNLSNAQILVHTGLPDAPELIPPRTPAQLDRLAAGVRRLAVPLDHAAVIPLWIAMEPGVQPEVTNSGAGLPTLTLARSVDDRSYRGGSPLYVATPDLLRRLGIDPGTVDPGTDFLFATTVQAGGLVIPSTTSRQEFTVTHVRRINVPDALNYSSIPKAFITLDALRRQGWKQRPAGWLVESSRPLMSA
jgi:putative ABC transport system permease protein